jgi:hypothetical protein
VLTGGGFDGFIPVPAPTGVTAGHAGWDAAALPMFTDRLPESKLPVAVADAGTPENCAVGWAPVNAVAEAAELLPELTAAAGAPGLIPGSVIRMDWFMGVADAVASSALPMAGRAGLLPAGVAAKLFGLLVGTADAVALSCPQGLLARQAEQDSHPANVIPVQTRPIKAIAGFVPIGFSFLHG